MEALSDEMRAKSKLHGVDIASGYEDMRFSAAMARDMEHAGVGFDVAAHAAWVARKPEPVTAIEAHLASSIPCSPLPASLPASSSTLCSGSVSPPTLRASSGRRCSRGQRRRRRGASHSAVRRSPRSSSLIGCSQPSGNWSRHSTHEPNIPAVSPPSATAFAKHVVNGRLYGQLHPGGAVTGRYTSSDPNLQNIPTDPEFRGFFRAPEGRLLVDVDYSQLELRVFAAMSVTPR